MCLHQNEYYQVLFPSEILWHISGLVQDTNPLEILMHSAYTPTHYYRLKPSLPYLVHVQ